MYVATELKNITDIFSPPEHSYIDRAGRPSAAHQAQLACATDEFIAIYWGRSGYDDGEKNG